MHKGKLTYGDKKKGLNNSNNSDDYCYMSNCKYVKTKKAQIGTINRRMVGK